jgi:tryptophan-rich sensory protein
MKKLVVFLILNFLALAIGSMFIGNIATDTWYQGLVKAPWTPPGWVFGAAWTVVMITFSIFLSKAIDPRESVKPIAFYILFAIQFVLNVGWNLVFFKHHMILIGMAVIFFLTALVMWFTWWGFWAKGKVGLYMLPYLIWLLIATSLNVYIVFHNTVVGL